MVDQIMDVHQATAEATTRTLATEEGVFQESLDFASLHSLPVLFVCEHNNYSVYSNIKKRQHFVLI
jgi:TPP-dependent pyruvate/acetoin dehydrogenase alpha subunit